MKEEWKEVNGYKYLYVSNLGRVKRKGHSTGGFYYQTEYLPVVTKVGDADTDRIVTIEPIIKFYEETMKVNGRIRYGGYRSIDYKKLMRYYWGIEV